MVNTCHEHQLYGGLAVAHGLGVTPNVFLAEEASLLFTSTNRYDEQVACDSGLPLSLGVAYILLWALLLPLVVIWLARWAFVLDYAMFIVEFLLLIVQQWMGPFDRALRGLLALLLVASLIGLRLMLNQNGIRTSR
jgi:hypothetical protein